MLRRVPHPNSVIPQGEIRQFKTISFERINYYTKRYVRLLNILDFDAVNLSQFRTQGVEVLLVAVKFAPHNFPKVFHLDLADTYYKRNLQINQRSFRVDPRIFNPEVQHINYERMVIGKIMTSTLTHIFNNPGQIGRVLRGFMQYTVYTCGLGFEEVRHVNVTMFCLKALHETLHPDGNLVVEVLRTYCTTKEHKEHLLNRNYSDRCLEYILESCRTVRFDIRHFFRYSERGRILGSCPIRTCAMSSYTNLRKLQVLVKYGFEPLELNGNMRAAICLGIRMEQQMRMERIRPIPNHSLHSFYLIDRRSDFLMELLYMVIASLGPFQEKWIECATLFFNSIVDPLFCEDEVAEVLNELCHQDHHALILQACNRSFRHLFAETRTPRSLKHQTRYVIRRLLSGNFQLPVVIDQLMLPAHLDEYLKLKEN